jgi:hypothetical protein
VTELGLEVLRTGEEIFDGLREQWSQQIGAGAFETFERHLTSLVGAQPVRFDTPGWLARDLGSRLE